MRLEANISLQERDQPGLPDYKVELKNINSFKFLKKALLAEISRQEEILSSGGKITQETRGYNERTGNTVGQRIKEEAQDYRYFPEPDLPPLLFEESEIEKTRKSLPELPQTKKKRYQKEMGLSDNYAYILSYSRTRAEYFEEAVNLGKKHSVSVKTIAGYMVNRNADGDFAEPAGLIRKIVKLENKDYAKGDEMLSAIDKVLDDEREAVIEFRSGRAQVIGYLIGKVQKELKGKGDPNKIRAKLLELTS